MNRYSSNKTRWIYPCTLSLDEYRDVILSLYLRMKLRENELWFHLQSFAIFESKWWEHENMVNASRIFQFSFMSLCRATYPCTIPINLVVVCPLTVGLNLLYSGNDLNPFGIYIEDRSFWNILEFWLFEDVDFCCF